MEKKIAWLEFIDKPDVSARPSVCDVSQFEARRSDGRKHLKWSAIPIIKCVNPGNFPPSPTKKMKRDGDRPISSVEDEERDDSSASNMQFELLKKELKAARKKINDLENKMATLSDKYREIFNEDQVAFLLNRHHRGVEWSDETIRKSLHLYVACGAKGYEELRKQNLPFPSIRTLQNRTRGVKLDSTPLEDLLKQLEFKVV